MELCTEAADCLQSHLSCVQCSIELLPLTHDWWSGVNFLRVLITFDCHVHCYCLFDADGCSVCSLDSRCVVYVHRIYRNCSTVFVSIAVSLFRKSIFVYFSVYIYRDLFHQHNLLSLDDTDVEVIQPIVRRPDILPRGIRQPPNSVLHWEDSVEADDSMQSVLESTAGASVFQSVAVLGTAVVVCGFGMQFCRRRTRQHRRHVRLTSAPRSRTVR